MVPADPGTTARPGTRRLTNAGPTGEALLATRPGRSQERPDGVDRPLDVVIVVPDMHGEPDSVPADRRPDTLAIERRSDAFGLGDRNADE